MVLFDHCFHQHNQRNHIVFRLFNRRYKRTASDALQDYIDHFDGRSPRLRHYTRRVSDLLSPKPKFKFFDAVEKRLEEDMSKSNEGLLNWINQSYNDSLKRTCVPIYVQQAGTKLSNYWHMHTLDNSVADNWLSFGKATGIDTRSPV